MRQDNLYLITASLRVVNLKTGLFLKPNRGGAYYIQTKVPRIRSTRIPKRALKPCMFITEENKWYTFDDLPTIRGYEKINSKIPLQIINTRTAIAYSPFSGTKITPPPVIKLNDFKESVDKLSTEEMRTELIQHRSDKAERERILQNQIEQRKQSISNLSEAIRNIERETGISSIPPGNSSCAVLDLYKKLDDLEKANIKDFQQLLSC